MSEAVAIVECPEMFGILLRTGLHSERKWER